MLLTADRVVTPERILAPGWVRVEGDRISAVGSGLPEPGSDVENLGAVTLAPGYVDAHCHGGGGASFQTGDPDEAARAATAHLRHGTTSMVASLVTDTPDRLVDAVSGLADGVRGGNLAGIHLEGPWLSPAYAGAHDPDLLTRPDPSLLDRLLAAGDGAVRMMTLAPELPGALEVVRDLTGAGVAAAVGHTDATYAETAAALDAGVGAGTHLFNAMRAFRHREPGPAGALLERPEAAVELIADGVHLHPAALRMAARSTVGGFLLVSDAMAAAAATDGDYSLGPIRVEVRGGVARTPAGAIAGSTLTMSAAVRYAVSSGLDLHQALLAASQVPADHLGLADVGRIRAGALADLVVLDEWLRVTRVIHGGGWVAEPAG